MNEQELANRVIQEMDTSGVCEFAAEKLTQFYKKNPKDFAEASADFAEESADAMVEAAAPEMLKALRAIYHDLAMAPEPGLLPDEHNEDALRQALNECREAAIIAIDKATITP